MNSTARMSLEAAVRKSLSGITDKPLYLAYSGGIDSQCLLFLLAGLRDEYDLDLTAVHIHHGLHPQADEWLAFCQQQAAELGIKFTSRHCELEDVKVGGLEAAAREARYQAIASILAAGGILLTAQHQDDQAETLLLQLLRGAGPLGLAGMPAAGQRFGCQIYRPLLAVSRQQIQTYARENQLAWCEDPSNQDQRFDRNYLRHQILPDIYRRWPHAARTLSRSAGLMAESQTLMDDLASLDAELIDCDNHALSVDLEKLAGLTPARQRNVLRFVLRRWQLALPGSRKLEELRDVMLHARQDSQPQLRWANVTARRYQHKLYLDTADDSPLLSVTLNPPPQTTMLGQGWQLCWQPAEAGIDGRFLDGELQIKYRAGGERFKPAGEAHHKPLKHWFQIWQVPPWQRQRIPLLYSDGSLLAVAGYAIAAEALTTTENTGWQPQLNRAADGPI